MDALEVAGAIESRKEFQCGILRGAREGGVYVVYAMGEPVGTYGIGTATVAMNDAKGVDPELDEMDEGVEISEHAAAAW